MFRDQLLGKRCADSPIVDLREVAGRLGIQVRQAELGAASGGCEALLAPRSRDRFTILVDAAPHGGWSRVDDRLRAEVARQRMRFRIAHELGHTGFYARAPGQLPTRLSVGSPAEEAFCDLFAASLLLPDAVVRRCRSAMQLMRIRKRFDVSVEVAVRSWAGVHECDAAVFYWTARDCRLDTQWASRPKSPRTRLWKRAISASVFGGDSCGRPQCADTVLLVNRRQAVVLGAP
jgi:hypothetical protein